MAAMHPGHREVLEAMMHTSYTEIPVGRIMAALHHGLGAETFRRGNKIHVRFRAGRCRLRGANEQIEKFHTPHDRLGNVSGHHCHIIGRWIINTFNFEGQRFKHWEWELVLEDMIHTRYSKLTLGRIEEALHYGLGAEVVRRDNTIIVRFRAGRCRVLAANDNVESFHAPHDGRGNVSAHHSHLIGRWIVNSFNFEAKRFKHWEWNLMCRRQWQAPA
ncbi:uncharacterized protein BXZ73DRAFT_82684 [Epithele typhae]|uniref:uncharacterized protein n=1 Tax=Epithele typhae TaxID=378194 RepID=UPI002007AE2A|nr:uncharacterized protein BXZ73DRAFT_82684 [Epithele typhae]KAH9911614.1 hypothetical protein BXZ73DRAFT_82684 [Epithele typhae]